MSGGLNDATGLIKDLREQYNIFCSVVIYPVVPKDVIMLRLIPTAVHTIEDVEVTISAFESVKHKLVSGEYRKKGVAIIAEQ